MSLQKATQVSILQLYSLPSITKMVAARDFWPIVLVAFVAYGSGTPFNIDGLSRNQTGIVADHFINNLYKTTQQPTSDISMKSKFGLLMDMAHPFLEWLNKTFPKINEINKRTSIPAKILKGNKKQQPIMVENVTQNVSKLQEISPISEEPNMVETVQRLSESNNVTVTQRTIQGPLNYTEDNQETESTNVTVHNPGNNNVDDQGNKQATDLSQSMIIDWIVILTLIIIMIIIFGIVIYLP